MQPLIILAGPTAVGKTSLSIRLAKAVGGEILSADSMQVYRGMDIGSAKITLNERQGVAHHLIDVCDPKEPFHVVKFQELARKAMQGIYERGHIPVLTGGTGFYIQAVLYDIDFTETKEDPSFRKELEAFAQEAGPEALHERLRAVDPLSADLIHAHNVKRVIRALEFYNKTGIPISRHNEQEREKTSPYRYAYFVLNDERQEVYRRIDARVDSMMEQGLLEEVKRLRDNGCTREMVSMQGLGYKEIFSYLSGECTLSEAVERIKLDTRHFAKRQITWFKREKDVIWVQKEEFGRDEEAILDFLLRKLRERKVIDTGT